MILTLRRRFVLGLSTMIGLLAFAATVWFTIAGAGFYGSPFGSSDVYFDMTLLAVLLLGPVAILPCTALDMWKPTAGGLLLCGLSICDVGAIVLNNIRQWGFATHDAGLGSFCLALPAFLLGTCLLFSVPAPHPKQTRIWFGMFFIAILVAAYFSWEVGADGISSLYYLLAGGVI